MSGSAEGTTSADGVRDAGQLGEAQRRLLELFASARSRGRLAHAYLLLGARGIGKRTFALALARQTLCPQAGAPGCDCLACHLDLQDLRAGRHPDLHWIDAPEGKDLIPVDQVREQLVRATQLVAFSAGARVFVMPDAHRMGAEAQNTTLKTLEEPGSDVLVILTTDQAESLLPTVRSRCHRIFVPPLSTTELAAASHRDARDAAVRLAAGSFLRLAELSSSPLETRALIDRLLQLGNHGGTTNLIEGLVPEGSTTGLESQKRVTARLDHLALVLRDTLAASSGAEESRLYFAEESGPIGELARTGAFHRLLSALSATFHAKRAVQSYVDPTLATLEVAGALGV